jgi:holo-[acyl-carrier protein] synthase
MDIVGIGIDAVDIPRVAQVLARFGERFLRRVFTSGEIAYCTCRRDPASPLAARFAAKEAAMKALGTGNAGGVLWQDIEVRREDGPPRLVFHGGAATRAAEKGVTRALLTLTHSDSLAFAEVMLIKD